MSADPVSSVDSLARLAAVIDSRRGGDPATTSALSRDHTVIGGPNGLVTVVGGKLTTYRQLAQDAVDDAFSRLGRKAPACPTRNRRYPGAQFVDVPKLTASLKARTGLDATCLRRVKRLVDLYGSRAFGVWQLTEHDSDLRRVIDPTGVMAAELLFAVDADLARSLTDVFARRLLLAFEPGHGLKSVDEAAFILAKHLGWTDDEVAAQIAEYREWLDKLAVPDPSGPRSESFGAGAPVSSGASR